MKLKSIVAVILALCMLCGALVACDNSSNTPTNANTNSDNTNTQSGNTPGTDETNTETPTESETKESTEEEPEPTPPGDGGEVEINVEAGLPETEPELACTMYGGYEMTQYAEMAKTDYLAACKFYGEEGYTLRSSNTVGNALSSVYVNGDAYVTVMYNGNKRELYLGESESGASTFPTVGNNIAYLDEPTITQHRSSEQNGMCYFIKLSDGSFIVVDGGTYNDTTDAYATLCELNGSNESIHIRAWFRSLITAAKRLRRRYTIRLRLQPYSGHVTKAL